MMLIRRCLTMPLESTHPTAILRLSL
jgi:hypothetical protein